MYYVNYPTCFPLFIQFMQSYGKYNNVQKFFSFFVYYRRRVCQNSLILKKSQSPDFHKPGLCYV